MKIDTRSGATVASAGRYPIAIMLVLLIAIGNGAWWFFSSGRRLHSVKASPGEYKFFAVAPATPDIYATGVVKSDRSAKISPPVSGIVRRVIPERFAPVRSGDILVELDDRQGAENLRQEKINLKTAQVQLEQAQAQREHLQSVRDRYEQLFKEGVIAAMTVDEAKANFARQEYEVGMAEQRVAACEAAIRHLKDRAGQTRIKSPIGGMVTDIFVTKGQFVAPGGGSDQASTLLVVSDTSELFAQLLVDEIDVSRIRVGQEIELRFDALPEKHASGRIRRIAPAPNNSQGKPGVNFETAVAIETSIPEVRVGMTVFAVMRDTQSTPRRIPSGALQAAGAETWVWQAEHGRARKKTVRVRDCDDGECVLDGGLEAGAVIVTGPDAMLHGMTEGQPLPAKPHRDARHEASP